jgi:hypothetical protein
MDTATFDQAYQRLQTEFQDIANSIQTLAQKLQAAGQPGDINATQWLGAGIGLGEDLINNIF